MTNQKPISSQKELEVCVNEIHKLEEVCKWMRENQREMQAEFNKVHKALACLKREAKDNVPIVEEVEENEFKKRKKRNAKYTLCSEEKIPLLPCNVVKKAPKKARLRIVKLKKGKRKVKIPKLRHSLRVSLARIVFHRKLQNHFALLHRSRLLQKVGTVTPLVKLTLKSLK